MVSEIKDFKIRLGLGMPPGQPLGPGFQLFELFSKIIYQYLSYKYFFS